MTSSNIAPKSPGFESRFSSGCTSAQPSTSRTGTVRRGRAVEREQPAHPGRRRRELLVGAAHRDDRLRQDRELRRGDRPERASPSSTAGSVRSRKCRWLWNGITSSPSATSAAVRVITGPSAPSSTGGTPYGFGPGTNVGGISVCRVNSPAEVQRGAVLPRAEDRLHRQHDLAHPGRRRRPGRAVPLLDVRPDLRAQPEPEPAAGHQLEVVRRVAPGASGCAASRSRRWSSGRSRRRRRPRRQRQEDVVRSLEGEQAGDPGRGQLAGAVDGEVGAGVELDVEEHAVSVAQPLGVARHDPGLRRRRPRPRRATRRSAAWR